MRQNRKSFFLLRFVLVVVDGGRPRTVRCKASPLGSDRVIARAFERPSWTGKSVCFRALFLTVQHAAVQSIAGNPSDSRSPVSRRVPSTATSLLSSPPSPSNVCTVMRAVSLYRGRGFYEGALLDCTSPYRLTSPAGLRVIRHSRGKARKKYLTDNSEAVTESTSASSAPWTSVLLDSL